MEYETWNIFKNSSSIISKFDEKINFTDILTKLTIQNFRFSQGYRWKKIKSSEIWHHIDGSILTDIWRIRTAVISSFLHLWVLNSWRWRHYNLSKSRYLISSSRSIPPPPPHRKTFIFDIYFQMYLYPSLHWI